MSLSEALAGFTAGVVNDFVLYHPDNLKYLSQNNIKPKPVTLATIPYHTRGIVPICFGGGLSYATYFYAYGLCKTTIEPVATKYLSDRNAEHSAFTKTLIAGIGGACAIIPSTLVSFPFDSVKKHTSVLPDLSARQVAARIYAEGGIKQFFFGWNYTLSRDIFMSAIKMGLFEGISKFMVDHRDDQWYPQWIKGSSKNESGSSSSSDKTRSKSSTLEASLLSHDEILVAGLLGGTLTGLFTTPVDCVVSRIRSPHTPFEAKRGFFRCAKWMMDQEPDKKVRIFFRGVGIRTANYAVGSLIFWGLFSQVQKHTAHWFDKSPTATTTTRPGKAFTE